MKEKSEFLLLFVTVELKQHYDEQVKEMMGKHHRELTQVQEEHKVELNRMQKALDVVSARPADCNVPKIKDGAGGEGREKKEKEGNGRDLWEGLR